MSLLPLPLNDEQALAVQSILDFLAKGKGFFLLEGYAGTGKTYSMQEVIRRFKGKLIFTAPTNKATKVLRETLTSDHYKPECRTIYSLLGLRLEANGEIKELAVPEDPVDLSDYSGIVVDEGSMLNSQVMHHIELCAAEQGIPFVFMADFAQLPPVGETASPISRLSGTPDSALLTRVMRHDNQILEFVTRIRKVVNHPTPSVKFLDNHDDTEGVWLAPAQAFRNAILRAADLGAFSEPNRAKVIAWRNTTVDEFNTLIRNRIFDNPQERWLAGDRLIATSPARDLQDEPMAMTDDEGLVQKVLVDWHPLYAEFKVYRLSVTLDDNRLATFQVLHPDSQCDYDRKAADMALAARGSPRLWKNFWEFKDSFHQVRYAYSITAHRAQGSTYETAFVSWRDVLLNRNRQEAYRCLYVACSRPKKRLILD